MIARLFCFVFGHTPHVGVTRRYSISFECARCGTFAPGEMSSRRKS